MNHLAFEGLSETLLEHSHIHFFDSNLVKCFIIAAKKIGKMFSFTKYTNVLNEIWGSVTKEENMNGV